MPTRVGTCSICGGDVMGYRGPWWSVVPPPPDTCSQCGAVAAGQSDVIPMVPAPPQRHVIRYITTDRIVVNGDDLDGPINTGTPMPQPTTRTWC